MIMCKQRKKHKWALCELTTRTIRICRRCGKKK